MILSIESKACMSEQVIHINKSRILIRNSQAKNTRYSCWVVSLSFRFVTLFFVVWTGSLILLSGDIHPNPGPDNGYHLDHSSGSTDIYNFLNLPNHLSTVHYNVQSLANKVDVLISEFSYFDLVSFSETWLDNSVSTQDLLFPNFHPPERKGRLSDRYGGVILYIKDNLTYIRRHDLELNRLECIWIQIKLHNKRNVLYGVFYRPPSSDSVYNSLIEDSIGLAIDSTISDIVVTGDFNLNTLNPIQFRKVESICNQFDMTQCIVEPTHFTENSATIIDLLFVTNKDSILTAGVVEPCLDLNIRYHCPIFAVLNFLKPKYKTFKRTIWKYEQGDCNKLRDTLENVNWGQLQDDDIDIFTRNITNTLTNESKLCVPNQEIVINPHEPPWINSLVKRKIRKRKRAYQKAKRTNNPRHWLKFKTLRNELIALI